MDYINTTLLFCQEKYNKKGFQHAIRVANYAYEMAKYNTNFSGANSEIYKETLYCIALLHDIVEDYNTTWEEIDEYFANSFMSTRYEQTIRPALALLTHNDGSCYEEYISRIIESNNMYALIVKRADMKDHLSQLDTLSDNKIQKYIPVLGSLM